MANTPSKSSTYSYTSNAGLELEGQIEVGSQIFLLEPNDATDTDKSHNAAMPLNVTIPTAMQWSPGSSGARALTTVVSDKSEMTVHASHSGNAVGSNETMLGLELGKRTYFKAAGAVAGSLSSNALGPSLPRKHRMAGQSPGCQVEGCKNDLNSAKEYHRRHKVCPAHSKAPRVIVRGAEQRFCQQCSRFHGLDAFDEGKRSCRNRLEGHNKRRRKPQPDPLSLSTRFLPAFQDSNRLSHFFEERSTFLPQVRIPGMSAGWGENDPTHEQKGSWQQRILTFEDQSTYEGSIPGGAGMERQLFSDLHHLNERSTLFSPRSPKGMITRASDAVSSHKKQQYFQASVNPLGTSLSLTSSSGAGVLSGLEAIPVGQGFPRVSDSGRALSLQSTLQFLSSTQGMVADMATHSNVVSNQGLQSGHIPTAQPLVQVIGQQHHRPDWTHDKLLSAASCLQSLSSTTASYQSGSMPMDKDQIEGPFAQNLNGVTGFDCVPMYSMFQGEVKLGDLSQDVKPTISLMNVVTSAAHGLDNQPLVSAGSFDLGVSHFQDLQTLRSYEASMDSSQGM